VDKGTRHDKNHLEMQGLIIRQKRKRERDSEKCVGGIGDHTEEDYTEHRCMYTLGISMSSYRRRSGAGDGF
jgi:hypothetical protein